VIRTERLVLVPGTEQTLVHALNDLAALGRVLGAEVPASWPPESLDVNALRFTLDRLQDSVNPGAASWWMYFVLRPQAGEPALRLIGTAGYKGPPSEGTVEIGYGLVADEHRRGYATEAARALIARAFVVPEVRRVIAETLSGHAASIGVLQECGFGPIEGGSEPGVIRFALTR